MNTSTCTYSVVANGLNFFLFYSLKKASFSSHGIFLTSKVGQGAALKVFLNVIFTQPRTVLIQFQKKVFCRNPTGKCCHTLSVFSVDPGLHEALTAGKGVRTWEDRHTVKLAQITPR